MAYETKRLIASNAWVLPQVIEARENKRGVLFADYAEQWFKNRRKPDGEVLSPSTVFKDMELLKNHLLKPLGNKPVSSIGYEDVQAW